MYIMKTIPTIFAVVILLILAGCKEDHLEEKGFQVRPTAADNEEDQANWINQDSLKFDTRPSNVLLTGIQNIRLTTIYKVNFNKERKANFIGSNDYYGNYTDIANTSGNQWNNNFMPGIVAVYGYNMVNISHYDINTNKQRNFFEKPVLIKTLYYPAYSKDTLNFKPVSRNYFMVSVYNNDTNKDGFINIKDLRRFYLFNINGDKQNALVPENYSVLKSEYDPENDFIYVFAKLDENQNGQQDESEPIHIYWVDLNDPTRLGRQF